ncbi:MULTISPECIES: FeoA family protein [Thermococcus]|nr:MULTISPECIES: FeoA family protein [Thermococcus]
MLMIVPLNTLRPGEGGIVVNIVAGSYARQRLVSMGLTPGTTVQIIESHSMGPMIISVGGVKFAIGNGLAAKVMVRKL